MAPALHFYGSDCFHSNKGEETGDAACFATSSPNPWACSLYVCRISRTPICSFSELHGALESCKKQHCVLVKLALRQLEQKGGCVP